MRESPARRSTNSKRWHITSQPGAGDAQHTRARKADHLRLALEEDVSGKAISAGFERYRLLNCALPEFDLDTVDTSCRLLGKRLCAPVLISCMTGGTAEAGEINRTLARTAQQYGFALGLGSGRALIEDPSLLDTFAVRAQAPEVLLLANIGAVQLNKGYGVDECRRLVEMLQADALVLHLNALQEAVQPEGDTQFGGLLKKIARLCSKLDIPVVAKEVGWGIDAEIAGALLHAGVAAIDVAGAGGTSWSEVERFRTNDAAAQAVASEFAGWGIPASDALAAVHRAHPRATVIASGGVRTGLDVLKALALGASCVGLASPFLRAAAGGQEATHAFAAHLQRVLAVGMFALGEQTIADLRRTKRIEHARDR